MTYAKKIMLLIVASMVALVGLAVFEYRQDERIYALTNFTSLNTVPSLKLLDHAYNDLVSIRIHLWHLITEPDPIAIEGMAQLIDKENAAIATALASYELKYVVNATDFQLLTENRARLQAYKTLQGDAIALAMNGERDQARNLLKANYELVNKALQAFERHRQYNLDMASQMRVKAQALKTQGFMLTLCIVFALLAAIGLIGLWTIRLLKETSAQLDIATELIKTATVTERKKYTANLSAYYKHAANDHKS